MKREWFEPGPDGRSEFTKLYRKSMDEGLLVGHAISAAFRALLAEDGEQEPPALAVGDVVRLDDPAQMCCEQFIGVEATITGFRKDGNPEYTSSRGDSWWPADRVTLIRRAGAPLAVDDVPSETDWQKLEAERDELKARLFAAEKHFDAWVNSGLWCWNVGGFSASLCWADLCDSLNYNKAGAHERRAGESAPVAKDAEIARLTAERDEARRAMIEAKAQRDKFWSQRDAARAEVERLQGELRQCNHMNRDLTAERDALQARIDAGVRVCSPVPSGVWTEWNSGGSTHTAIIIDAAMVDERTGPADRREKNLFGVHGRPGKSDRRRVTPSTRADRGEAS